MLLSLDYDNTWTAAPDLWQGMVEAFKADGHRFVCVTSRKETAANKKALGESIGVHMQIVYCDGKPKAETAKKAGFVPDIWIDDRPETINSQAKQWV
ncbi:hypothetical protein [Thiothrix sp.]|jgi:hypothetical protein|uniref:hypothetical protein n=1 Tax=Thiothrix sp. TaxID=1032 RepID=UPI00257C8337|nr:hypothetical protein [Thiothrix sp.]